MRLNPARGVHHLRAALATSVLLVDSRIELPSAIAQLGGLVDRSITAHALQALRSHPAWDAMQTTLIRLAAYLDRNDVPIDYARRRQLDYTALLPKSQWIDLCNKILLHPGADARHHIARHLLTERISGVAHLRLPDAPRTTPSFRRGLARFPFLQSVDLREELDRVGHEFLTRHGIHDEPLTWQPSVELLEGLVLPGDDPRRLNVTEIHQRIRAGQAPLHIAQDLGTDLLTLRYVADQHPLPSPERSAKGYSEMGWGLHRTRRGLTKTRLEYLYLDQGLGFTAIADQTGIGRKSLAALADEYGIPRRSPAFRGTVDRDWLHEQLIEQHRTLTDLAAEAGMSPSTMARWAHRYGIRTRTRPTLRAPRPKVRLDQAPPKIRSALATTVRRRRLRTFIRIASYTTLTHACRELGLWPASVTGQIQRLERDLGGRLLDRAGPTRPMRLTAFGEDVVEAYSSMLHLLGTDDAGRPAHLSPPTTAYAPARTAAPSVPGAERDRGDMVPGDRLG